jgi:glycolate oxidase iron-sulfur subunit
MNEPSVEQALREADRCVKCGLCLPTCPTYRLYADENESPRGRIALAEGLMRGQLEADEHLADHLYRCLLCRRCETACPSGVNYVSLIDAARAKVPRQHWTNRLVGDNRATRLLQRIAQAVPLPGSNLSALARALPSTPPPSPGRYPARGTVRGKVGLFLGCVTSSHQGSALSATLDLLSGLGYAVIVPTKQGCCGALAQHQGDVDTARAQIAANRAAFEPVDTIVSTASGCSVQLGETLLPDLQPVDIVTFLQREFSQNPVTPRALEARAAVHLPCSAVNGLHNGNDSLKLLGLIPGLKLYPLGKAGECCGAAGDHLLTERWQAETLRQPLLDQLIELKPRYLLTSNIGCALHLAEGAKKAGLQIEVLHPVELLGRQLTIDAGSVG